MIQHIMPKQFRMIRHWGLYARNKVGKIREVLASLFEGLREITRDFKQMARERATSLNWRERIKKSFGKDPLICLQCGSEMILYKIWHPRYGVIYHYLDHLLEDELIKNEKASYIVVKSPSRTSCQRSIIESLSCVTMIAVGILTFLCSLPNLADIRGIRVIPDP